MEIERYKEKDKAMKNKSILLKDEGNFYKKKNEISKYKGQVPTMNKFVKFGAGISENESETSNKNLMEKRKRKEK